MIDVEFLHLILNCSMAVLVTYLVLRVGSLNNHIDHLREKNRSLHRRCQRAESEVVNVQKRFNGTAVRLHKSEEHLRYRCDRLKQAEQRLKSSASAEHRAKVITKCDERKTIGPLEDGYQQFWTSHGAISAVELRIIADELDKRNADWDAKVKQID